MDIVGIHLEHDGAAALIRDGQLRHCFEAQKDNGRRYSTLTSERLSSERLDRLLASNNATPDVLAVGGWFDRDGGYCEHDSGVIQAEPLTAIPLQRFATSHVRAHIWSAYGLSPFPQGQPCYVLVWEGEVGAFYAVDEDCNVSLLSVPLREPGHRYGFAFEVAHSGFPDDSRGFSYGVAGKLMALAGIAREVEPNATPAEPDPLMEGILNGFSCNTTRKSAFRASPYFNIGPADIRFRRFARRLTDAIFDAFYRSARESLTQGWPLLIAGGCGLNCEWNTRWRDSGLFSDVFVPPCPDDSGAAIGAAVDAQRYFTGRAKIDWDVYCGEPFEVDVPVPDQFVAQAMTPDVVARLLMDGAVLAWVEGRYELGPRALGHRSLLASPLSRMMRDRLNTIKAREPYRPIAPVCAEEMVSAHFAWSGASPYMLYFQHVEDCRLEAITHDDGTARVQTVTSEANPRLYALLGAFARLSGCPVLCNTSLNFAGRGFINRMSDLVRYATTAGLDGFVVDDVLFTRR